MRQLLPLFLCALVLLQTFSRELVVLDYQVHKARITELFCVNKDQPKLHCNGRCHLAKQLGKVTDAESKAPAAGFAKVKYEVLPPSNFSFVRPSTYATPTRFGPRPAGRYSFLPELSIFYPPSFLV